MRPAWRVAALVLCWLLLAWAAFVQLLFGRRGTIDVHYEPANREALAMVPRYGPASPVTTATASRRRWRVRSGRW
jgi:hypothetical protein